MIYTVTFENRKLLQRINEEVGGAFDVLSLLKNGGLDVPRFRVQRASLALNKILLKDTYANYCEIEMRPAGILFHFRAKLDEYVWAVPYGKLTMYNSWTKFSLFSDDNFLELMNDGSEASNRFMGSLKEVLKQYKDAKEMVA